MRRLTTMFLIMCLALGTSACSWTSESTAIAPLDPLGPTLSGGLTKLLDSGFAVSIPADWSVEVAAPEHDLAAAQPGDAWEALRAYAPGRRQTCSVYVAVPPARTTSLHVETLGLGAPRWTGSAAERVLEVPQPEDRVENRSKSYSSATAENYVTGDKAPDNDVVYAVVCGADVEPSFDGIIDSLVPLPVE